MSFIPLSRVEEGERLVWGFLDETPDRDGECFDYASSKPHFQQWSASLREASGGKNLGNMREMHSRAAAGGLVDIQFDDANKRIALCGRIVDDGAWAKVRAGVYTGFSPGGKLDRFRAGGQRRYTAKPTELSLVDLPSNPNATFTMLKAAGGEESVSFVPTPESDDPVAVAERLAGAGTRIAFAGEVLALGAGTLAKMWGATDDLPEDERLEKRAFSSAERKKLAKDGKALPDGSFPIETKADLEAAIHAIGRAKDQDAAKQHIIERAKALDATDLLPDGWLPKDGGKDKLMAKDGASAPMAKGLFTVSCLSGLIAQLADIAEGVTAEAAAEADGSDLPAALADWIAQGAEILTSMASEESGEAVARLRAAVTALPAMSEAESGAGDPDAADGGMAKRAGMLTARMVKMAGQMAGLREDLGAATAREAALLAEVTKLQALPAAPKGRLRAVGKGDDIAPADPRDSAEEAAIAAMPDGFDKAVALHRIGLRRAVRTTH